ncbi:hypothetical protein KFZ76_11190 [Methylovulum psychrotolerans]|uniref:hypothetical protein n=1 Tax=Methylovulum psychrotolerans TaxID=1704499 RepID=UPI001BFF2FC1|nr:hypothetical protein [Methylovulum psychrotolerans]MBT9098268.1 hypothetical protein [Methylovulum psychrotolerans]
MHDWILLAILVAWTKSGEGRVTMTFTTNKSNQVELTATGLVNLAVPKYEEWGPSNSVNRVFGPVQRDNGNYRVEIELQSGDTLTLEAKSIQMPEP